MSHRASFPLLFQFLNDACTLQCVRGLSMATSGKAGSGRKEELVNRLLAGVSNETDFASLLNGFTVAVLTEFLKSLPKGGARVPLGQTKDSIIAAFYVKDQALSSASVGSADRQRARPSAETAASHVDADLSQQLVVLDKPTRKLHKRLHKCWRKLAKKGKLKDKSQKIKTALKEALADKTKTVGEVLEAVEERVGEKLQRCKRAFFDKCIQKAIPKLRASKKNRKIVFCSCRDRGNPLQEFRERRMMQLEDYASSAYSR